MLNNPTTSHTTGAVGSCDHCGNPTRLRSDRVVRFCSRACASRWQYRDHVPLSLPDRFWAKVAKSGSCWTTTGGHHAFGYGMIMVPAINGGQVSTTTQRVSWFIATGHWPTRWEYICHDCPDGDNPSCVRNDTEGVYIIDGVAYERRGHLWLGSPKANMRDKILKGRQRGPWSTTERSTPRDKSDGSGIYPSTTKPLP